MTKASYICNFIKDHPDNWRELLAEKQIKVKDKGVSLSIFNYDIMADFSDPVVQEARGIIIDTDMLDVVCFPFRKFGNSYESYVDTIDWNSAKVQEKVDGSIVKLWHLMGDRWMWSSNSCIDAKDAKLSSGYTVLDLIEETDEFKYLTNLIKNGELDENNTYIFELVGPRNQVVIKYNKAQLYHIGTRCNETGKELGTGQFAIMSPREYPLHSLKDCLAAAKELNKNDYPDNEGFVVVDKDFHRIKVKAPEYLIYHHMVNNGQITKERAFDLLYADDFNPDNFDKTVSELPEYAKDALIYYRDTFKEMEDAAVIFVNKVRQMAKGASRKEIALQIKNTPYAGFAFKGLDKCDVSAEDIVKENRRNLLKLAADYEIEKEEEMDLSL